MVAQEAQGGGKGRRALVLGVPVHPWSSVIISSSTHLHLCLPEFLIVFCLLEGHMSLGVVNTECCQNA